MCLLPVWKHYALALFPIFFLEKLRKLKWLYNTVGLAADLFRADRVDNLLTIGPDPLLLESLVNKCATS